MVYFPEKGTFFFYISMCSHQNQQTVIDVALLAVYRPYSVLANQLKVLCKKSKFSFLCWVYFSCLSYLL